MPIPMTREIFGWVLLAAMLWLLASSPAAAAEGVELRGRQLAYACMGCHGIENYKNAYPKYSVPKIGGQSAEYLAAALAEYQSGARWHPTMKGFASGLSEQDRADLAAFFASVSKRDPTAKLVGAPPAKAATCAACHGQDGVGTMPENPTLAGQHADYIAQSLDDYRLDKRKNPIMGTFAKQLTRDEMRELGDYFSRQTGLTTPKLD